MASVNKVILVGYVGRDPEMRYLPSGVPVATFSVATSRRYRVGQGPQSEMREETEWHNCQVWNKSAEFVNQYVRKGTQVFCEGRLKTRKWDGQDGQKHYRTEIDCQNVQILDRKNANGDAGGGSVGSHASDDDDWGSQGDARTDIPF